MTFANGFVFLENGSVSAATAVPVSRNDANKISTIAARA